MPGCGWQAGGARGGSARAPGPGEDQRPAVSGSPEVACLGRPRQACPAHGLALQGSRRCTWPLDGGRAGCWPPRLSTVVSGTGPRSRVQDGGGTGSSGGQGGTEPGPLPQPRLPKVGALTPTHRDALGLWLVVGPGGAQSLERAGVRGGGRGPVSSVCLRLDAGLARDPLAPGDWVGAAAGAVEPWGAGSEPRDVCSPETLTLDPRPLTAGPAPRSARAGGSRSSGQPRQTPLLQTGKLRQTRGQGGPGSGGSRPGAGREGGGSVLP